MCCKAIDQNFDCGCDCYTKYLALLYHLDSLTIDHLYPYQLHFQVTVHQTPLPPSELHTWANKVCTYLSAISLPMPLPAPVISTISLLMSFFCTGKKNLKISTREIQRSVPRDARNSQITRKNDPAVAMLVTNELTDLFIPKIISIFHMHVL